MVSQLVWVWALAGDIVLGSWARHFTLTVPLSTQVYKWVPANLMLGGNILALTSDQPPQIFLKSLTLHFKNGLEFH